MLSVATVSDERPSLRPLFKAPCVKTISRSSVKNRSKFLSLVCSYSVKIEENGITSTDYAISSITWLPYVTFSKNPKAAKLSCAAQLNYLHP
jgi:hypothetical protein